MKVRDAFGNIRLRNKLVLSYIIMALAPFLIFAIASSVYFVRQLQATTTTHTAQLTAQVSGTIDVYINSIEKTMDYAGYAAQRYRAALEENRQSNPDQTGIRETLTDIRLSHEEIAGILIATDEAEGYVEDGMSRISRDPFSAESWYRKAEAAPGRMVLISNVTGRNITTRDDYSVDDVFSLAKALQDPATGEVWGVVLFDVRHTIIEESIGQVSIGDKGFVYIMDGDGGMVYTQPNQVVYRIDPAWFTGREEFLTTSILGETYQLRLQHSGYTGWNTVGVFSLDETMGGVYTVMLILALCILATVLLLLVVSFRLGDSVTRPISRLRTLMRKAEEGDLSVRFQRKYQDEIGDLGQSFNHMIERIDKLIRQVYVEQQHMRDAEIKVLQEQIKPHFLYNTLDSIGWMAREYEAQDIVRLVEALTSMFRVGLSQGKDFITLKDEITHVSNYLYIQKIRYKEKLNYEIEAGEDIQALMVPKLILQPLVENAIYHGIKEKRGGGCIEVVCRMDDDQERLLLEVRDNGAGMPADILEELRGRLGRQDEPAERSSFGLFYIAERIRLSYKEDCDITVESALGTGTSVVIKLPAVPGVG